MGFSELQNCCRHASLRGDRDKVCVLSSLEIPTEGKVSRHLSSRPLPMMRYCRSCGALRSVTAQSHNRHVINGQASQNTAAEITEAHSIMLVSSNYLRATVLNPYNNDILCVQRRPENCRLDGLTAMLHVKLIVCDRRELKTSSTGWSTIDFKRLDDKIQQTCRLPQNCRIAVIMPLKEAIVTKCVEYFPHWKQTSQSGQCHKNSSLILPVLWQTACNIRSIPQQPMLILHSIKRKH